MLGKHILHPCSMHKSAAAVAIDTNIAHAAAAAAAASAAASAAGGAMAAEFISG